MCVCVWGGGGGGEKKEKEGGGGVGGWGVGGGGGGGVLGGEYQENKQIVWSVSYLVNECPSDCSILSQIHKGDESMTTETIKSKSFLTFLSSNHLAPPGK